MLHRGCFFWLCELCVIFSNLFTHILYLCYFPHFLQVEDEEDLPGSPVPGKENKGKGYEKAVDFNDINARLWSFRRNRKTQHTCDANCIKRECWFYFGFTLEMDVEGQEIKTINAN